jgi:hypothetical protein
MGSLDRQPGIANPAWANDREQRALSILQQLPKRGELWFSTNKGGEWSGEISGDAGLSVKP